MSFLFCGELKLKKHFTRIKLDRVKIKKSCWQKFGEKQQQQKKIGRQKKYSAQTKQTFYLRNYTELLWKI